MLPQPDAPAPGRARDSWIDQFDPCILKRGNQLHERIDVGPDDAVACLHALNGRNRKICEFGGLTLIDIEERARGPELISGDHGRRFLSILVEISLHHTNTGFKHQFEYMIYQWRELTPRIKWGYI
jgi:hypothetical protein